MSGITTAPTTQCDLFNENSLDQWWVDKVNTEFKYKIYI